MNETDADATTDADANANATEAPASRSGTLCTGVVTIAADRSLDTDAAGEAITAAFEETDGEITVREHVGPDHDKVQSIVSRLVDRADVDVVITAGATGVEPDDITIEAVEPLLGKELTAFSELFTHLGYEAVGTRVVGARTLAGVADGTTVFCLPGDADAAELALEEIILPEAPELVERARDVEPEPDDETDEDGDRADADAANGGE